MSAPAASGDQQEWKKFLCRACGLIYDERDGDPDSGLPPGTRFENIPDDWLCPICGVTKVDFEPYTPRARAASPAVATMGPREVGVIVIGAGLAGWSVAAAIRALDADVPVTLVTGCPGDVYHKPELSVALSRGMSPGALRRETGAEAAARLGVHLMAETFAVGLSAVRHRLRTTRGTLPYTSLIIAQGARPALPPGFTPELCWRINNLQAWTGLHRALAGRPQSVAIVGAGMVGCELAEDLARAGHAVTLFGAGRRPLEALLPAAAAARLQTGLEAVGVRFLGASLVEHLARCDNGMVQLRTRDGACFDVDQVVSAIGLATETRLARSAGLDFDKGIVVDPVTLRSSVADIHALGDCASIGGMPCRFIEPIARQADAIAHAVLGRSHVGYAHSDPVIRLKTRSTPIVIRGSPTPGGEWRVLEDTGASLRMEQWQGGAVRARLAA